MTLFQALSCWKREAEVLNCGVKTSTLLLFSPQTVFILSLSSSATFFSAENSTKLLTADVFSQWWWLKCDSDFNVVIWFLQASYMQNVILLSKSNVIQELNEVFTLSFYCRHDSHASPSGCCTHQSFIKLGVYSLLQGLNMMAVRDQNTETEQTCFFV